MPLRAGKSNYPYAVARIQAKRAKLIPEADYAKLLKMDVNEITAYVQETDYKAEVDELAQRFRGLDLLEAALTVNEERTFAAVRQMLGGPGGALVGLYLRRFTVDALKTVLRGKLAGATRDELLKEMLLEDFAGFELFNPLLAEDVRSLEDVIGALDRQSGEGHAFAKVLQQVPPGSPLARYEEALDKAHFAQLVSELEGSDQSGADKLLEFVRREVDAVNLLNAARWVHAGSQGDFSPYVVPGGRHLKVAQVVALSRAKDLAEFAETLGETKAYPDTRDALEASRKQGTLSPFQAAVRRAHLQDLDRLGHANPLSVVPILLFLIRKHNEVVTLRALARGKAAGLSESKLEQVVL